MPTQDIDAGRPGADSEVLLWPDEEVDVHAEGAVQSENDTATFSAATVLSGDGEVDHAPPSYPRLLDTDSELDYQYDQADIFLPVSSAVSLLLLSSSSTLLLKASAASQRSRLDFLLLLWDQTQISFLLCPCFPALSQNCN